MGLKVRDLKVNPLKNLGCPIKMMTKFPDGREFGIIEIVETCRFSQEFWIEHYHFANSTYALILSLRIHNSLRCTVK